MALPTTYADGDTIHATDINNITTAVNASYTPTGTDVAVADGGTGASDASTARTNLGVAYGTGVGTVCQGNDTRLADTRTPTDNTVTSAKIVDGAIVDADVNASAGIVATKLAAAVQTSLGKADTSVQSGGALGTPSGGTLTSCTGLPVAGIAASTSTALGVGSIELGHATDTTIARGGAGSITVEGVNVCTISSSDTLTNKTLTNPTVTNYVETVVPIGTVTTTNTISLTSGTVQTATLTASTGCTFTMPTATAGKSFVLLLKQAASTGNGTATFTGVKWNLIGTPVVTATAGTMDIFSFVADGSSWYGSVSQGYTP